ncbi:MAG: PilC/PilY family type IV pilus protein [Smithella sp.]
MKRGRKFLSVMIALALMAYLSPFWAKFAAADEQELFTSGSTVQPNVLLILDNSQSMDEDFVGNAIGAYRTNSRLVEGKRALQTMVNTYASQLRLGLMTYKLPAVTANHLHNAAYHVSYDPKSWCPSPPAACGTYCKTEDATAQATCQSACGLQNASFDATYRDAIITNYAASSEQRNRYCDLVWPKTNRIPNPNTAESNYIYHKLPGTYYSGSDQGYRFLYSTDYTPDENPVNDHYKICTGKTGTGDGNVGYTGCGPSNNTYGPSDEDTALGFADWGRRWAWYHTSRVWFANSSPGGGYLDVACGGTAASLLAKLNMKENDETGYMSCGNGNTCAYIVAAGLTPTEGTFKSAINYFKGEKDYKTNTSNTSPITDSCQKNFVVYVTDGLPSVNASGTAGSATALMPAALTQIDNLRALVKTLGSGANQTDYTFNVKTYVLGMALTDAARPELDRMASHGGTAVSGHAYYADDTAALNSALTNILSDIVNKSFSFSTASVSSSRLADENFIYEASFEPSDDPFWKGYLKKWSLKADGSLDNVLWEAGSRLSTTAAADRNIKTLIGGSLVNFKPSDIDATVPVSYLNMSVADQATANKIIKYVRGYDKDPLDATITTNPDGWKLGDVFHSNPITIGTPSPYFTDFLDSTNAFAGFRSDHPRASNCEGGGTACDGYGKRLVIVGANDGQFHAFNASTGLEYWSFVPPNLLPKLQYLAHYSEPSALTHNFFVDGPVTVADVWLGTGSGYTKAKADWKTLAVFSLGRNDRDYTAADKSAVPQSTKYWSWNSSCDGNLKETYDGTDTTNTYYYCGYYAFDFTNVTTTEPSFKWKLNIHATKSPDKNNVWPYMGEPWSKMNIGRVKINGQERWVGFIGGGYNYSAAASTDMRGKGVFAVDLSDGAILWSFTHGASPATTTTSPDMEYPIAAPLTIVDTDNDGFVDYAYVGDLKGNMWQFQFCMSNSASSCNTSNWKGSLLLSKDTGADKFPLYNQATMAKDGAGNIWLYWATGDKAEPTGNGPAQYVFGLKPVLCRDSTGAPTPCSRNDLANITSQQSAYCDNKASKVGWYINLAGLHEQVLAEPVAFGNVLYFTSFTPASGSGASCTKTGTARLYAINIGTNTATCNVGTGVFAEGARSMVIGVGIASAPMISLKPGTALPPDIYATTSGAGSQESSTVRINFDPPTMSNRTNMLFWKDKRLQ